MKGQDEKGNFKTELDRKRFSWALEGNEKRDYALLVADRFLHRRATISELRAAVKTAKGPSYEDVTRWDRDEYPDGLKG